MKSTLLLTLTLLCTSLGAFSQPVSCSQFCVTEIGYNLSFPEMLAVRIQFTSDTVQFINYPYVVAVLNENGDTLAKGDLNFFGQFSNTSQDYPVTAPDSFPSNFTGTVVFRYDFDTINCELPFPCAATFIHPGPVEAVSSMQVNPNPLHHEGILHTAFDITNGQLELMALTGQVVRHMTGLYGRSIPLSFEGVSSGLYLLKVEMNGQVMGVVKVRVE